VVGRLVSHFRIDRELGRGGMGVVYLAEDLRLGRRVALKVLPPEAAADAQRRSRFEQEARVAAALNHPSIATVYELARVGDDLCIIFEYVEGPNLRQVLRAGTPSLENTLQLATEIAHALSAAHAAGVVHRDLKPENVILSKNGPAKVLDFGLARFTEPALDGATIAVTVPGTIVGTVAYMSPEQLETRTVDHRSDIFSFGVMLYECAAGEHPFGGDSTASTIARILTAEPKALIPPELDRIVRKCLRKRCEERYQSVLDLAVDLENLKKGSSVPSTHDDTPSLFHGLRRSFRVFGACGKSIWFSPWLSLLSASFSPG